VQGAELAARWKITVLVREFEQVAFRLDEQSPPMDETQILPLCI
jgi:hypothetical protein